MTDAVNTGATPVDVLVGAPVARISPDADLHEVCDALAARGIGILVVGDGSDVDGVVSERDVVGALAERRDPATTRARDVAHTSIVWCDAEATVAEVAERMMETYVRHVLLEDDGQLVGVVSARDLLGAYASAEMEAED